MASNAANQIFTNAAPPTYTVDWSRIVLFIVLFVVICAIAYVVYINFIVKTTTFSYPFHQDILSKWNEWYGSYGSHGSSNKSELIQPEHNKTSEDVTSDHTKLTGEQPELIGSSTDIHPPSSQPTATPSAVDAIAESIVHNGESDEHRRERKHEREHRGDKTGWKRPHDERENWCFVGEDLSGRYCVRVPSDKECTSERLFHSRVECEMAAANHLPAGILTRHGDKYVPLATKNIV